MISDDETRRQAASAAHAIDEYRVGVGRREISPPPGAPLGGYAARTGVAVGVDMPLRCTAFAFGDRDSTVCAVTCDLLFITDDIVDSARTKVADRAGLGPEALFIHATHTHSGPAALTRNLDATYVDFVSSTIAEAVEAALANSEPASLTYIRTDADGIGMNRRDPAGARETTLRMLIAESLNEARVIAVVMNYACHATVLEADNLMVSSDFPGYAVKLVEAQTGALAGYFQGCAGAINPIWIDHTRREAARVGEVLGAAALHAIRINERLGSQRFSINLSRGANLEATPHACHAWRVTGPVWAAHTTVQLRRKSIRPDSVLRAAIAGLGPGADDDPTVLAQIAALAGEQVLNRADFQYWPAPTDGTPHDTVGAAGFGFGNCVGVVGLPSEPFLQTGEAIRRNAPFRDTMVFGYTDGMVGYMPVEDEYYKLGYEVGMARYEPGSAEMLATAVIDMLGHAAPVINRPQ